MYWEGRKLFKSLFTDERNVCAENPNESARRKPLELIGKEEEATNQWWLLAGRRVPSTQPGSGLRTGKSDHLQGFGKR